jgi:hypothetical protein
MSSSEQLTDARKSTSKEKNKEQIDPKKSQELTKSIKKKNSSSPKENKNQVPFIPERELQIDFSLSFKEIYNLHMTEIEAKTKEVTIDFAETVTDWYKRIKNWVDGGTKVIVNFWSGTVGQWLQTVLDWVRHGIKIGVEFFNKGVESLTNETGLFQGGEASGPQWGEPSVTDPVFVPGWNAKGLNYVPYDGYALVHRGETILNQDKSRSYRENNSFSPQDLYNAVAAAVESAISNIQINLDGKQVGNAVTNQVSKNIYKAQYGRRFTYA